MDTKDWLPLVGVGAGWMLNQFGQWFVFRRDERKAIGKALADLLDIRHRLLSMSRVVDMLSQRFGMPTEAKPYIRAAFEQFFPADAELAKRYSESVALVAATDPVLGYRLRSKDMVSPLLNQLRAIALATGPEAGTLFTKLESELMRHIEPQFEELIRLLARRHGWRTWWQVRGVSEKPLEIPEDLIKALTESIPKPPPTAAETQT